MNINTVRAPRERYFAAIIGGELLHRRYAETEGCLGHQPSSVLGWVAHPPILTVMVSAPRTAECIRTPGYNPVLHEF